jgi:superfamily II DNA helicase RecQ
MDTLIVVMTETCNMMMTMKTGGGTSMLWMVHAILNKDIKCIVVCPFVTLLDEQFKKTVVAG